MHDLAARVGFNGLAKSTDPFVLGHEFCGKVLDYGPKTRHKFKADTLVCAMPLLNVDQHGYLSTDFRQMLRVVMPSKYWLNQA